jgi:hypothetical protein
MKIITQRSDMGDAAGENFAERHAMKRRNGQEQKLADDARLMREWRKWHREQLEEALAGVHRDVLKRLMAHLEKLHSARALVALIESIDWGAIDARTRLVALHETSQAICRLRESQNLPVFDDPLWDAPFNAFLRIREVVNQFPAPSGESVLGVSPSK